MAQPHVLMLENDHDDRYFTESTLAELGFSIPVHFVSRLDELINSLQRSAKPSLILLSHNAFPAGGLQALHELRSHPEYLHIPVVILSEGIPPDHINQYYRSGANSVIVKPSNVEDTRQKMKTFFNYWLQVAEL